MSSPVLHVRPMGLSDFEVRIAYFHEATDEHLEMLGVDRSRLPMYGVPRLSRISLAR